jgi:hypothetical protein
MVLDSEPEPDCDDWWDFPSCGLIGMLGFGTAGLCLNGQLAIVSNISGEVCIQMDKNGVFFTATGADPMEPYQSWGWGCCVGASVTLSNAHDKHSLDGLFDFGEGNAGLGVVGPQASYSTGLDSRLQRVHVVSGGLSFGSPFGGSGGMSNTAVSGYLFSWCDIPSTPCR